MRMPLPWKGPNLSRGFKNNIVHAKYTLVNNPPAISQCDVLG
ncbi:hypothetical protein ALT785_160150 [Alteromonas infernus]